MVGAGAVGGSLAYWVHAFGADCRDWTVVDGDVVELHNTNRGMVFTPRDSGWPDGTAAFKAHIVASSMRGAKSFNRWYHECDSLAAMQFDVVLALANDYDVRERLTQRHAAVSFQATTGENWLSQLHRHILGTDGCIACRTGELRTTAFACSTVPVEAPNHLRSDAALPFLSAASGLMLALALDRLTIGDEVEAANCWSWDFDSGHRMATRPGRHLCHEACTRIPSAIIQRRLALGTRWVNLVGRS